MRFNSVPLSSITQTIIDCRGKTPAKLGSDWAVSGYRALSAKNVKTGKITNADSIRFVDEKLYSAWMKEEVQRGDILITSEAPAGEVLYWDSNEKIVLSQRLFCIRIKESVCSKYVYYYMQSPKFRGEINARSTGTTVTGLRQPELLKCTILLPDYDMQVKVVSILSAFDDKIALNEKINDNLVA